MNRKSIMSVERSGNLIALSEQLNSAGEANGFVDVVSLENGKKRQLFVTPRSNLFEAFHIFHQYAEALTLTSVRRG